MSFTTRWHDVYLAAGARAVSTCGDFLAATALTLALQQAGAGGTTISALMLAATVPLVVLAPLTGRLADRVDSRIILVATGSVQAVICAALAFAGSPALIIALVAALACGLAVTQPTLAALLPAMVRREDLSKAGGINQTAGTLGMLLAPALAGVLVGQFGTRLPLLLDAMTYLALVVAGLLLRTRRGPAADTNGPVVADASGEAADPSRPAGDRPRPVVWRMRGDRLLTVMIAAVAAVVGGVGAINVVEVFFVRETLGASATMYGLVTGAWTAGCLVGSVLFGRLGRGLTDPARLVRGLLVQLAACCAAVLVAASVRSAAPLIALWLVGGAFNGAPNVSTTVVIALRVPERARGRAFAVFGSAVQGAGMGGLLLGGVLLGRFDPRVLIAGAGAAGLVAVAACVPSVRAAVRRERPAEESPTRPKAGSPTGPTTGSPTGPTTGNPARPTAGIPTRPAVGDEWGDSGPSDAGGPRMRVRDSVGS
jgi:MFS family permease